MQKKTLPALAVLLILASLACEEINGEAAPVIRSAPTVKPAPGIKAASTIEAVPTATAASKANTGIEVVGEWLDPGVEELIKIYSKASQLQMEYRHRDGRILFDFPVVETRTSKGGRRFEAADIEPSMHYVIDARGDLQIWDTIGIITTARKVE